MKNLFTPIRADYCTHCGTDRALECYTKFDKPINYPLFLDELKHNSSIIHKLDNYEIEYMLCRKCKTEFFIDWRNGYPEPIRDFILVEIFLNNYY